jgi:hypothetical protein
MRCGGVRTIGRPLSSGNDARATDVSVDADRRTCGQPSPMWTTSARGGSRRTDATRTRSTADGPRRQAEAAAAGALLLDEVDEEPESDFFDEESEEDELFASPEPFDDDESADTFSLGEPPESTEPERLSVR